MNLSSKSFKMTQRQLPQCTFLVDPAHSNKACLNVLNICYKALTLNAVISYACIFKLKLKLRIW